MSSNSGSSNSGGRGGGGGSDTIIDSVAREKPKNIMDVIAEVEFFAGTEAGGGLIPEGVFTTKDRLDIWMLGFKSALLSGLVTTLMTPITLGVIEKSIPIFGDSNPTLFDQIFAFVLAISFSLGYGMFIATACKHYKGTVTKQVIKSFIGGITWGASIKAAFAVVLFHWIYFVALQPEQIQKILLSVGKSKAIKYETLNAIYIWVLEFKPTFLMSAYFVILTTIIFLAAPRIVMWKATIDAAKLHKEDFDE